MKTTASLLTSRLNKICVCVYVCMYVCMYAMYAVYAVYVVYVVQMHWVYKFGNIYG